VSGEAILSGENSGKLIGGQGCASNPSMGALGAPPGSLTGREWVAAPSPRTPSPLLAFGPSVFPHEESWARPWMSLVVHCLLLQSFDIVG